MIARLPRALAAAPLGALVGAAALIGCYAVRPALVLDMTADFPPNVRGIYAPEQSDRGPFAWTMDRVDLALAGLDRNAGWELTMRVRAGRPPPADFPDLVVSADGLALATVRVTNDVQEVTVPIPSRRGGAPGLRIRLTVSNTFTPGPADPRRLGVVIERLRLQPVSGVALVPRAAIGHSAAAAAIMGAAFALTGAPAPGAVVGVVVLGLGQAAAVSRQFGPFARYLGNLEWLALWIAAGVVVGVLIAETIGRAPLRNTARFAVIFTAGALYLKLLVLLHPAKHIGDAMFHAHRFQLVLAGTYYFTSVAPGDYEFPYAVALYVFAKPFVALTRDHVLLLRVIVAAVDASAGLLLYRMVARAWGDRLAAAMAVALFHLVPIAFAVQGTANLTNSFGQSLSVAAMAVVTSAPLASGARHIAAMAALLAIAFLSHASTFAILFGIVGLTAALYLSAGGATLRVSGWTTLAALVVATILAVAVYYAHFPDVYRSQWDRISREVAGDDAARAARPSYVGRARVVPESVQEYFGWPLVALAGAGAVYLIRRRARDRLGLALAGWLLACLAFLVLGVITPVDMRYYLAAFPAVAMLAAVGASLGWRSGAAARGATIALLGWTAGHAINEWLEWI